MKTIQVKIIVLLKRKYIVLTIKEEVLLKVDNVKLILIILMIQIIMMYIKELK